MQGVILAAGRGTRLHPVSTARSKATVPVCGLSLIERVMASLRNGGVDRFVIVAAPGDERLSQIVDGLPAADCVTQPEPRGAADALACAAPRIDGPFLLSACDSIVADTFVAELVALHRARRANATLALRRLTSPEQCRRSGVIAGGPEQITGIVEKPEPADAPSNIGSLPLYLFEPRLLDYLSEVQPSPRGELELQDAIAMLIARDGNVVGALTDTRRQVTSASDLLALNRWFLDRGEGTSANGVTATPPVHLGEPLQVGAGSVIGPYVVAERGCRIGAGATVSHAVLLDGAQVAPGATIDHEVVVPCE